MTPLINISSRDFFLSPYKLTSVKQDSSEYPVFLLPERYADCLEFSSSISHHRYDPVFATASSVIEIWDETKTSPLSTLKFHSTSSLSTGEHIVSVAFNKTETSVLASSGSDRTVCLYDLRSGKAIGRVSMNVSATLLTYLYLG